MATGWFRQDLFYRLSTVIVHVEPLRNRPEDIPILVNHYFKKYASAFNNGPPRILSRAIMERLMEYSWPGNVRELQNVLQRLLVLNADHSDVDEIIKNGSGCRDRENKSTILASQPHSRCSSQRNLKIPLKKIKKKVFQKIEKELICYALEKTYWNRAKAAEMLGISYKSLLAKIEEFGLAPNMMPAGPRFKYLTAVGEVGFADPEPEVLQFVNPTEPNAATQSVAN